MAANKRQIDILGTKLNLTDVPVKEAKEYNNEYELEDGTKLLVKSVATVISRVDDQYLPDGRPIYFVLTSPVVTVLSSPYSLTSTPQLTKSSPRTKKT